MLKDFETKKLENKTVLSAEIKELQAKLLSQQQLLMKEKLPMVVLIEGWSASGKGTLIKELISELDPRFYHVESPKVLPEAEERFPYLYQYVKAIPVNGKVTFLDSGWMEAAVRKYLRHEITKDEYRHRIRQVNEFERQLRDSGYVILKIFLHIGKQVQYERLFQLVEDPATEWRVDKEDLWQHKEYKRFMEAYDEFMDKTGDIAGWHILDGSRHKTATRDALRLITQRVDRAVQEGRYEGVTSEEDFPLREMPKLAEVDLSPSIDDEEYKKELKKLQTRISELHNIIYRKKIPVILCYEGWDAAGKGGNIRRLTYALDPRGFDVHPIASPLPHELSRQYLWRFWTRLPKTGHICIFDRTWYGRVMVERLEGFCSENEWRRAYHEINEFERMLTEWEAVLLKFWIHIDQDIQLERFTLRENTPEKQWKITDEDWRNREKWDEYEVAVDEMLSKTSTKNAPWYIIESNDKKYARIKTLKIIVKALEKACEKHFHRLME
ncbi:MAG: phosphate--AMP phosphotransferase [Clostridia bacterium]|nr:phosphate--AMP phosphotransferase [Clostridia bacterium]